MQQRLIRRMWRIRRFLRQSPMKVRSWWFNHITPQPYRYTDRFDITSFIRRYEDYPGIISRESHFNDEGMLLYLETILKPGMTVFDIGSNKGIFTLFAAARIAPGGHVHAFEPVRYTFDYLTANVKTVPDTATLHLNQLAVFNENGQVTMNLFPPEQSTWNSIGFPKMGGAYPIGTEQVAAITVDEYCRQHNITTIDVLKIDVEGFETEVIQGAMDMVTQRRVGMIIFEISLDPQAGAARSTQEVLHTFMSLNFDVHVIRYDGTLELIADESSFTIPYFANYAALLRP